MRTFYKFEQTKLYEVLVLLGQKQLNDLKHFVNLSGNDLTERQKLTLLEMADLLSNRKKIDEKKVAQKFYGSDMQYWPKAKTHIINTVMRYLKFHVVQSEEFLPDYGLLKYFETHKCNKNFAALYKKINDKIKKGRAGQDNYYCKPEFDGLATLLLGDYKLKQTKAARNEKSVLALEEIVNDFTEYYVVTQIRLLVELINRNLTVRKKIVWENIYEFDYLLDYPTNNIKILVNQYILKLLIADEAAEENLYNETRKFIIKNSDKIDKVSFLEFFKLLNNYCFKKINNGNHKYVKMGWLNYQYLIDENMLVEETGLNPYSFLNMVLFGLKLRKLKPVTQLLRDSKIIIDNSNPALKKAVDKIALVTSLYHQAKTKKQIQKCLRKIRAFKYDDLMLSIQLNKLIVKIYFDLKQPKKAFAIMNNDETKQARVLNFYVAVKNLFHGKTIKNFERVNFNFLDYDWLKKRQQDL